MSGKGKGVSLSPGELTVKLSPLPVPLSLSKAIKDAANKKGVTESHWRREAYQEKLDGLKR